MESKSIVRSDRLAIAALVTAGLGWGTTGLFVRTLGSYGLSVYELLLLRLTVTAAVLLPITIFSFAHERRKLHLKPTVMLGFSMVLYYLSAIAAFTHLQLVVAALIIGTSPLIAWLLPLLIERRRPTQGERSNVQGVMLALLGLILLLAGRSSAPIATFQTAVPWIGYLGGFAAAFVTVLNARYLNRLGTMAPKPLEIAVATALVGMIPCWFLMTDPSRIETIIQEHAWQVLGFGFIATAVPGLAIAYASVRLPPQATSTVSIQLQVWAGVLAWIILGEAMTGLQIVAAGLIVVGSWICVRKPDTGRSTRDTV